MFPLQGFRVLLGSLALGKITTPHFLPHKNGVGRGLGTGCGRGYGSSGPWALTERRGVTRTNPYLGSGSKGEGEGQGGQGSSEVGLTILAGSRRQAQPDRGKAQVAITPRSCTAAGV